MHVLVTGALGSVGSYLTSASRVTGHEDTAERPARRGAVPAEGRR